jgi:hypothetical protein
LWLGIQKQNLLNYFTTFGVFFKRKLPQITSKMDLSFWNLAPDVLAQQAC